MLHFFSNFLHYHMKYNKHPFWFLVKAGPLNGYRLQCAINNGGLLTHLCFLSPYLEVSSPLKCWRTHLHTDHCGCKILQRSELGTQNEPPLGVGFQLWAGTTAHKAPPRVVKRKPVPQIPIFWWAIVVLINHYFLHPQSLFTEVGIICVRAPHRSPLELPVTNV